MHSPGEVSKTLNIPSSTLRRWAVQFGKYLSESANLHRRQYTDQDITTLEYIKKLSGQGVMLKDIPGYLDNLVIDQEPLESSTAIVSAKDVHQLRSVIAQLRSDREEDKKTIDDLNDRMDGLIDLIIEKLLPPGQH